jgi:hypothetical protein
MPCCDFKVRKGFPVYAKDFPDRFRSGEIYDEVRKYTCSCDGCMYGSYPEITITARNYRELFKRAFYFNTAKLPELKKFSTDELMDIADRIRGKNYERQTGAGS